VGQAQARPSPRRRTTAALKAVGRSSKRVAFADLSAGQAAPVCGLLLTRSSPSQSRANTCTRSPLAVADALQSAQPPLRAAPKRKFLDRRPQWRRPQLRATSSC